MKLKKIRLRISWGNNIEQGEWFQKPIYRTVPGHAIDDIFAIWREPHETSWHLTHRRSGFCAGFVNTVSEARQLIRAFYKNTPKRHWRFRDARCVKSPEFKGCGKIVEPYKEPKGVDYAAHG